MLDVVYRTGKIGNYKSDYICNFSGGNRSTGYFGTGYYFCVRPSRCITMTREKNELLKLTLKKGLKWLPGTIKKHDLLKHITSFVTNYDLAHDKEKLNILYWMMRRISENICYFMDKESEIIDHIESSYRYDLENEFCTDFRSFLNTFENREYQRFVEAASQVEETKPVADFLYKEDFKSAKEFIDNNRYYFNYDTIDSLKDLNRDVLFRVYLEFDLSEKEFLNWAAKAYEYYKEHAYDQMDSISTKFLKYLGYDGVWPSDECDNTTYGGVVFERENIEDIKVLAPVAKDWNGLDESRKVTVTFDDDREAEDFKQEMKDRYKYPTVKSKHHVVHGKGRSGRSVFVEGKDFAYKAKVGGKWLKGRELVNSKKDADTFESETEPTQRINQLKKKHKLRKNAKVRLYKIKEASMENTFGWHLSPYSFSEPEIRNKTGFGTDFYGAGFYVTLDKETVSKMVAEAQDMFAKYFIYTIKVDERANIVDEYDDDGLDLYAKLVEQFGGDEVKASAEMVKRGVDGILYYNEEDGNSIVFYNPKMAKIVKTDYHEGWGDRNELQEKKLKEYSNAFDDYAKRQADKKVSKKDKWNLKMDIESLKKELMDLQNTAANLPDEYVRQVCNFDAYPFEDVIDEDQGLNTWCAEVDDFLNDSLSM